MLKTLCRYYGIKCAIWERYFVAFRYYINVLTWCYINAKIKTAVKQILVVSINIKGTNIENELLFKKTLKPIFYRTTESFLLRMSHIFLLLIVK